MMTKINNNKNNNDVKICSFYNWKDMDKIDEIIPGMEANQNMLSEGSAEVKKTDNTSKVVMTDNTAKVVMTDNTAKVSDNSKLFLNTNMQDKLILKLNNNTTAQIEFESKVHLSNIQNNAPNITNKISLQIHNTQLHKKKIKKKQPQPFSRADSKILVQKRNSNRSFRVSQVLNNSDTNKDNNST